MPAQQSKYKCDSKKIQGVEWGWGFFTKSNAQYGTK